MKRIKTIKNYAGLARFLADASKNPVAWIARCQTADVAVDRYSFGPSKPVLQLTDGRRFVYFETAHKRYEAYEVPANFLTFKTDDQATDWHIRFSRKSER